MKWKNGFISIGNWLISTVLYAIFPFGIYFLICWLYELNIGVDSQYLSELCAFTMVIVSSMATDIINRRYPEIVSTKLYPIMFLLFAFYLVAYGVIYSWLLRGEIGISELSRPLLLMKILSIVYFIIALVLRFLGGIYEN